MPREIHTFAWDYSLGNRMDPKRERDGASSQTAETISKGPEILSVRLEHPTARSRVRILRAENALLAPNQSDRYFGVATIPAEE